MKPEPTFTLDGDGSEPLARYEELLKPAADQKPTQPPSPPSKEQPQ